jgi:hypothetical protein
VGWNGNVEAVEELLLLDRGLGDAADAAEANLATAVYTVARCARARAGVRPVRRRASRCFNVIQSA